MSPIYDMSVIKTVLENWIRVTLLIAQVFQHYFDVMWLLASFDSSDLSSFWTRSVLYQRNLFERWSFKKMVICDGVMGRWDNERFWMESISFLCNDMHFCYTTEQSQKIKFLKFSINCFVHLACWLTSRS